MGSLISGFVRGLYVLKSGSMNTGAIKSKKKGKNNGHAGSPDPPRFRCSPEHSVQHHEEDRAADERDANTNQLLPKPLWETLGGQFVLMLANEVFVNVKGKAQDVRMDNTIRNAVTGDSQRSISC